jgi:hypothetical protein
VNDRVPCEFFLIRYVPDVVKGEYTNIGILLREAGREDTARVRFTRDWTRVRCMDADADIGLLEALEGELVTRLRLGSADNKPVVAVIEETFSNSLQMTEAHACLAENMVTELELLMRLYVEPLRVKTEHMRTGRAMIAGAMRTQFERAGVWALMRKRIAAAMYTQPGDPMKIDCGYRPNGVVKMFHAVSLDGDVETAKVLAYTAPGLRDGIVRVEGARLELTAVVEPLRSVSDEDKEKHEFEEESVERYRFAVETMQSQEIRVLTTNDLARAAQTARVDLRL